MITKAKPLASRAAIIRRINLNLASRDKVLAQAFAKAAAQAAAAKPASAPLSWRTVDI